MVKLYRDQAQRLLVLLAGMLHARTEAGARVWDQAVADYVRHWVNAHPDSPVAAHIGSVNWRDALEDAFDDPELLSNIHEQLAATSGSAKGDTTLVDTIVEILGLPYGGARLSGETMTALRKAILRPSEIAQFRKLAQNSFACDQCGHSFTNSEVCVVRRETDHHVRVRCIRCEVPTYAVCKACGGSANISEAAQLALTSGALVTCSCKGKGKKAPEPSTATIPDSVLRARPNRPDRATAQRAMAEQRLQDARMTMRWAGTVAPQPNPAPVVWSGIGRDTVGPADGPDVGQALDIETMTNILGFNDGGGDAPE